MRQVIGGNGTDTTAAVKTWLAANTKLLTRFLYLIGEPDHPQAIWATNHETPLLYPVWGQFQPAVISKTPLKWQIGLNAQSTTITWAPGNTTLTASLSTASPLQLARAHFYDNWPVRIWKVYMPTPGDCNTLGAAEWFMGRVGGCTVGQGQLKFQVANLLDAMSEKIPANVIEVTNTLAGFTGATAPPSSSVPVFEAFDGSTETVIYGDCLSPTSGHVYDNNTFNAGYMIFLDGAGATLAGAWSAVGRSLKFTDGHSNEHNEFDLYSPLPWPPTPGVDQFYVSTAAPIDQTEEDYYGFPWVPAPSTAV